MREKGSSGVKKMVICMGGMKDGYGDRCEEEGNGYEEVEREEGGDGYVRYEG